MSIYVYPESQWPPFALTCFPEFFHSQKYCDHAIKSKLNILQMFQYLHDTEKKISETSLFGVRVLSQLLLFKYQKLTK